MKYQKTYDFVLFLCAISIVTFMCIGAGIIAGHEWWNG